jgi:hypothetical protein
VNCLVFRQNCGCSILWNRPGVFFSEMPCGNFKLNKSNSENTKTNFSRVLMKWVTWNRESLSKVPILGMPWSSRITCELCFSCDIHWVSWEKKNWKRGWVFQNKYL